MKYCSDRCRNQKPGPIDKRIEEAFAKLLDGEEFPERDEISPAPAKETKKKTVKGDPRITVECSTVEEAVFGSRQDPGKIFGRRKNRASRALKTDGDEWKSVDMEDDIGGEESEHDESSAPLGPKGPGNPGPMIRPPQTESDVNGSVGGEKGWAERKEETAEELEKRREGQRRAEEREMVRRAARRGCAFGFVGKSMDGHPGQKKMPKNKREGAQASEGAAENASPIEQRRKCEAVMNGVVVEASFAKGEWAIRWRDSW